MNIRLATMDDGPGILGVRTDVRDYLTTPFYGNDLTQDIWMRRTLLDPTTILLVMEEQYEIHGYGILHDIDHMHRRCMGQVQVHSASAGKGWGMRMWKELLTIAMSELGMARVYLEVLCDNTRAIHLYEKLGMRIEGTLRKHYWHNGEMVDVYIMGILREEWDDMNAEECNDTI